MTAARPASPPGRGPRRAALAAAAAALAALAGAAAGPSPAGGAAPEDAALLARLPALVGLEPPDGARFEVEWEGDAAASGAAGGGGLEGLGYDARGRRLTGRPAAPGAGAAVAAPVAGRVRLLLPVPAPARPIQAGEVVAAADLGAVEVDLLGGAHPGLVREPAGAVGREARRALRPGRPILVRDLRPVPAVARRDLVTVLAKGPHVTARPRARALDDGAVGDAVRVQNLDSRRTLAGTVVAPGVVEVTPGAGP